MSECSVMFMETSADLLLSCVLLSDSPLHNMAVYLSAWSASDIRSQNNFGYAVTARCEIRQSELTTRNHVTQDGIQMTNLNNLKGRSTGWSSAPISAHNSEKTVLTPTNTKLSFKTVLFYMKCESLSCFLLCRCKLVLHL